MKHWFSNLIIDVTKAKRVAIEKKMVFLEDPRMIFADMRLHPTSTPTVTPTRYHRHRHRQKFRPQNNNNCRIGCQENANCICEQLGMIFMWGFVVVLPDADLQGDVDGPELSGDDRSITSDVQDVIEANLDHDSMDSDREALNLVSVFYTTIKN